MKGIKLKSGEIIALNQAFNMDCLDFIIQLPDNCIDLVFMDPPYGINQGGGKNKSRNKAVKCKDYKDYGDIALSVEHFNELIRISKNQIFFGANHYISRIPYDSSCWIVWDKDNGKSNFADCELAWTSFKSAVRTYKYRWNGMIQGYSGDKKKNEVRINPNQKPVKMVSMVLKDYTEEGQTVFDGCGGSFSTPISCDNLGLYWFVCEKDKDYFESGNNRYIDFKKQKERQPLMEF